jgi:hypothetical protein
MYQYITNLQSCVTTESSTTGLWHRYCGFSVGFELHKALRSIHPKVSAILSSNCPALSGSYPL